MTELVGILNITPDSFSDGGKFADIHSALNQTEAMIEGGANIIDIGAESTRPGAVPLTADEEWARLSPILPEIKNRLSGTSVRLSLDTRHAQTARRAISGHMADWINDVSGGDDPMMRKTIADSDVVVILMHHLGIPSRREIVLPEETDVIQALSEWTQRKIGQCMADNIPQERIIIDPGLGFGKNAVQSWHIVRHIDELQRFGVPLLVGHSRKSFLSSAIPAEERDLESYAVSQWLAAHQVDYLRVHDVKGHRRILAIQQTIEKK